MDVPYDELDAPVRLLVELLNDLPGVATIGSCGGHADGESGGVHAAADEWWVTFELAPHNRNEGVWLPTMAGWLSLEFLAWQLSTCGDRWDAALLPYAPTPSLNEPGRMVRFEIRGYRDSANGVEPHEVAQALRAEFNGGYHWCQSGHAIQDR